jgi:hypothetical protein
MTLKKDFSAASRIASALVFGVVVSVLPNITAALCALFFSFLIIFLFPTDAKHLIKRWLQINLFILFESFFSPNVNVSNSLSQTPSFSLTYSTNLFALLPPAVPAGSFLMRAFTSHLW